MPLFGVYNINYSCHYRALANHRVMKKNNSKNSYKFLAVALRLFKNVPKLLHLASIMS